RGGGYEGRLHGDVRAGPTRKVGTEPRGAACRTLTSRMQKRHAPGGDAALRLLEGLREERRPEVPLPLQTSGLRAAEPGQTPASVACATPRSNPMHARGRFCPKLLPQPSTVPPTSGVEGSLPPGRLLSGFHPGSGRPPPLLSHPDAPRGVPHP